MEEGKEKEHKEKLALLKRAKESASVFQREFRKSTATAIIAAFGFIIALAWQDVVKELAGKITALTPIQGKLFSAVVISAIAVAGILITTKLMQKES